MTMDLYYITASPPCGLVLLVAAALKVKLNLIPVDLMKGEHLKPEYIKINPQHTVPTLVDDGFALWESRAIARYLVNKSGGSKLYPEDPQTRALVDQRIDFDAGSLYPSIHDYFFPMIAGVKPDEKQMKIVEQNLEFLNTFLDGKQFAVGTELTLADLTLAVTVSTIEALDINLGPYPNVERWYKLVKSTAPEYEAHQKSMDVLKGAMAQLKAKLGM